MSTELSRIDTQILEILRVGRGLDQQDLTCWLTEEMIRGVIIGRHDRKARDVVRKRLKRLKERGLIMSKQFGRKHGWALNEGQYPIAAASEVD